MHAVQRARRARQSGGDDKGDHLVLGDVDADALGGDAVVPERP